MVIQLLLVKCALQFFNIFETAGRTEIGLGLLFEILLKLPYLQTAVIRAIFNRSGKFLVLKLALTMLQSNILIFAEVFLA